jgi:hypothetical protein
MYWVSNEYFTTKKNAQNKKICSKSLFVCNKLIYFALCKE